MKILTIKNFVSLMVMAVTFTAFQSCSLNNEKNRFTEKNEAGEALNEWFASRSFPFDNVITENYSKAFQSERKANSVQRSANFPGTWQNIGPMNFGGRTLCLAFNPQNPNTIFAGSASGGLWKSYSGGTGVTAWQPVPTGFPVIGVAAIAFHPADSNVIYIGTGEVYNYQNTGTGVAVRTTRGTYGIGILKSTNGGSTWTSSLNWQYSDLRGVQDIIINPQNPNTIFAATTEGTYRSLNGGSTWTLVHTVLMATDLAMNPADTTMIFVAAGDNSSPGNGIYKSVNGGNTFTKLTSGLPASFTGKAMLNISPSQPNIIYASVANQLVQIGFYKSTNSGTTWTLVNNEDVARHQGWYSHDVAIHPTNPNTIICAGIDTWKSTNGGITLVQKSYWYNWDFSATPIGGPEGPPDYVHGDIHRVYYHPLNFNKIYFATDGGVFISDDGGETFAGANGMYHCTQFYANFSCSASDSLFAIGGLQDNASPVYEGNPAWRRVIGGDGLSTAIDPTDDNFVYGSSQYLNINRSDDKAQNFNYIANFPGGSQFCFAGPYVLSPSNPNVLYAGSDEIFKSTNQGDTWNSTNGGVPLDGNPALAMAISPVNSNLVYAATAPVITSQMGLFKTVNGGTSWTNVTSNLPNRYLMDIAIDPVNSNTAYVALAGFGTAHFYKTINAGTSWTATGTGLPDVPTNCITIDPLNNLIIYIGNDLGIYVSIDGGNIFQTFNDGLYDATMVFDISISTSNRMLRLATHGKGVYERKMLPANITSVVEIAQNSFSFSILQNPVQKELPVLINSTYGEKIKVKIFSLNGQLMLEKNLETVPGENVFQLNVSEFSSAAYFISCFGTNYKNTLKFVKN